MFAAVIIVSWAGYVLIEGWSAFDAFYMTITDVHALGLEVGQGLILTDSWCWDLNDTTRAFAKRFWDQRHAMPSMEQAGTYSSVLQS